MLGAAHYSPALAHSAASGEGVKLTRRRGVDCMIDLRDYQESGIQRLRRSIKEYLRSILVSPTGSGKTRMAIRIMQGAAEQGNTAWFIVHRRELCNQTSREFWKAGVTHGMIMSGKTRSQLPVQVGTVGTACNRVAKLPPHLRPRVIVFDEAHRSVAPSYLKIIEACPDAYIIGLTATPERTDGKGLGEVYRDLVHVADMRWLIDKGYLSDYRLIAPSDGPDLTGVRTKAGDYDTKELTERMDKPTITGDAIAAYKQFANGKRCMVFCVSIKHSEHTCEQYNAAGIRAEHIDGTNSDTEREAALERFRKGETLVLCSVQLAIEGLDIPAVEAVQQLRPTKSVIVYLQLIGRGLRLEDGKDRLIILDQVNNWKYHGLPDDPREWSLDGRKKGKRKKSDDEPDVNIQQCPQCFSVFRKGPTHCPSCGVPVGGGGREIEQVDGALAELDLETIRKQKRREQGAARTLEDLVALGVRRGMGKPHSWAAFTMAARQGRKPTPADFKEAREAYERIKHPEAHSTGAF